MMVGSRNARFSQWHRTPFEWFDKLTTNGESWCHTRDSLAMTMDLEF